MDIMASSFTGSLLVLVVLLFPGSTAVCPRLCACSVPAEVHCTFRSLSAVPTGISSHVQRINLGFNGIHHITNTSFRGLEKLELLLMHGNGVSDLPDATFQDLALLQVLKLSYNKLKLITSRTFSGLTGLIRLHLDHNSIQFIQPGALNGMTALRLLHLEANQLQMLHASSFTTFTLLHRFPVSGLKHLYLSENLLRSLPRDLLENMPQLETLLLDGNPWSCDCRMHWLRDWILRNSGLLKCRKDRSSVGRQLCPICASPQSLTGTEISDVHQFICSGPAIRSSGENLPETLEDLSSELRPFHSVTPHFGNISFGLSDEHGMKVDLTCQILQPSEPVKINWTDTRTLQITANVTLSLSVECPIDRDDYETLWRLLAYYSEVPVHLRREIMLQKEPQLSYRYRQDTETEAFYYTGVRADVLARPSWLMQSDMKISLNRPQSSSKSVMLLLNTLLSTTADQEKIREEKLSSWVIIKQDNKTHTSFVSVAGGEAEMSCKVLSSGNPAVWWIMPDGSKVKAGHGSSNGRAAVSSAGRLHIKPVEHQDAGMYYCTAEIAENADVLPVRLSVVESSTPLPAEKIGSSLTRSVGDAATLDCFSTASPDGKVNWIFPDGTIMNQQANTSRAIIFPNGSLFIPTSQLHNNGYHKCVVINQLGEDMMAVKLTVVRRQGAQIPRQHPIKPQSASGVSTRVKAFLEDLEEASGDGSNSHERASPNRRIVYQRNGLTRTRGRVFGNVRTRRPVIKGAGREQNQTENQRPFNGKQIDPQKWAHILAKIRERSSQRNSSYPRFRQNFTTGTPEQFHSNDSTESSSDDFGLQEEPEVFSTFMPTASPRVDEGHTNANQTLPSEMPTSLSAVTFTANPTSAAHYGLTEINAAGNVLSAVTTERGQTENKPLFTPQSENKNHSEMQYVSLFTTVSTSKTIPQGASENSSQSRGSRRRLGGKRRLKLKRPFSNFTTSRTSPYPPTGASKADHTDLASDIKREPTSYTHTTAPAESTPTTSRISTWPEKTTTTARKTSDISESQKTFTSFTTFSSSTLTPVVPTSTAISSTTAEPEHHSQNQGLVEMTSKPPYAKVADLFTENTTFTIPFEPLMTKPADFSLFQEDKKLNESSGEVYSSRETLTVSSTDQSSVTLSHTLLVTSTVNSKISTEQSSYLKPENEETIVSTPASVIIPSEMATTLQIPTTAPRVSTPPPSAPLQTTASVSSTSPALRLMSAPPSVENKKPFYSRNPGTNFIDQGETPRPDRFPYFHLRNPASGIKHGVFRASSVSTPPPRLLSPTPRAPQTRPVQSLRPRITSHRLQTVAVNAGTNVELPCVAKGQPKHLLTWTKVSTGAVMSSHSSVQRFQVHPNGTFVIQKVQLQDRGQYVCSVRNLHGVDTMILTLVVLAHVPKMLQPRHRDSRVYLGGSVLMDCQAEGLPKPNISWVLPDRSVMHTTSTANPRMALLSNGSLQIKQTSYLDTGVYKCIASNVAGADMLSVRLQISALPPMIREQRLENLSIAEGLAIHIHCSAAGAPGPVIRWVTSTGTQIRPSQSINRNLFVFLNGTLLIRSPTEKDAGSYECVAVNSVGVAKRTVNLHVRRDTSRARIISTSSRTTNVRYGNLLSLDCSASGTPEPTVIWRIPSKKLVDAHYSFDQRIKVSSNGSLSILSVTDKDEGDYLCVARNKMGDDYILLKVNVEMKAAKIDQRTLNNHKVSLGSELKVDCLASGLPDPEITWSLPDGTMVNNNTIQSSSSGLRSKRYGMFDNGTLYLNRVGVKEEGDYTCYAQNQIGKDEMKVHIRVLMDPPFILNNSQSTVQVPHGESVFLSCRVKGNPTPSINWVSPANRHIPAVSDKFRVLSDGTLHVQKVQMYDSGNYTCLARNSVGMDRSVVHVKVLVSPPVIVGVKSPGTIRKTVMRNQHVLLDCKAEGNPVPQVTWILPNDVVLPAPYYGSRVKVHRNGTLDIGAVRKTDSEFLCIAQNGGGEAKLQFHLDVREDVEKPWLRGLSKESITLTNGESVVLNCSVHGQPKPDVTWILPNGSALSSGDSFLRIRHLLDGTLLIRTASAADTGLYRCVGHNSAGNVERTVTLESRKKPEISNRYDSLISIVNGESLELSCMANGQPLPKLTWTLPSGVVLTRPQRTGRYAVLSNGTLTVQRASVYDRGLYRCQTTNQYGSSSLSVSVIVIAYPPRITRGPAAHTYGRAGVPLQLSCSPLATPKADVVWEVPQGVQLKIGTKPHLYGNKYLHPDGALVIQNPSSRDNGVYKCIATNVVGSDSRSTYVHVF